MAQWKGYVMPVITGIMIVVLSALGARSLSTYETAVENCRELKTLETKITNAGARAEMAWSQLQSHLRDEAESKAKFERMQEDMREMNQSMKEVQTTMQDVKLLLVQLQTREDMRSNDPD